MKINYINLVSYAIVLLLVIGYSSCKKEIEPSEQPIPNGVSINLVNVPYSKLSSYRFFEGELKNMIPAEGVIEYSPASTLFTDYALKKRFIWIPSGKKAKYVSDSEILDLPVGSALIKHFYYNTLQPGNTTKIIETRIMIRKMSGWIFAEYVWNDEQTEAYLDMNGSYQNISWIQDGSLKSTNYRIPSETECFTCHKKNEKPIPIAIKPQNLNCNYTYEDGAQNQLQKLISIGALENTLPSTIYSTVDYHDVTQNLELRLRSYLDINCAHCHSVGSHCDYRPMRLAFSETTAKINIGVCVPPDEYIDASLTDIVAPSNINRSMMHFRMNATDENTRMPLLGRTLVHEEGVQLLEDWINSISTCE